MYLRFAEFWFCADSDLVCFSLVWCFPGFLGLGFCSIVWWALVFGGWFGLWFCGLLLCFWGVLIGASRVGFVGLLFFGLNCCRYVGLAVLPVCCWLERF